MNLHGRYVANMARGAGGSESAGGPTTSCGTGPLTVHVASRRILTTDSADPLTDNQNSRTGVRADQPSSTTITRSRSSRISISSEYPDQNWHQTNSIGGRCVLTNAR